MSNVSGDDVRYLAALSNLQINDQEAAGLQADIGNILNYVEQLKELDTEGVEPTYQVTGLENISRADTVLEHPADREALLSLAPDAMNDQVKVPKVL